MKILVVHNSYGKPSGEEAVVEESCRVLRENGHELLLFARSSAEISGMRLGKARAFFGGIYSWSSKWAFRRLLRQRRPDVVHVHNVYPLISPSVLGESRRAGLPVVMTVHNYRLICPNGLHMVRGRVCERCVGGREYWCVLKRCEGSLAKSIGYAARNVVGRKLGLFRRNVTVYAALTQFQRGRLIAAGFPSERIAVVPNMVAAPDAVAVDEPGRHVGYVGRISPEKGLPVLLEAARRHPEIPFRAAGANHRMPHLEHESPANVEFAGHLDSAQLSRFYRDSRIILLCSGCYEGFPTVLVEAMLHGRPVICSRIGGLGEIVDDGRTGLLFAPGDAAELAEKIALLYRRPELCRQMGVAGREKALREYSPRRYYERLMEVYRRALELGPGGAAWQAAAGDEGGGEVSFPTA